MHVRNKHVPQPHQTPQHATAKQTLTRKPPLSPPPPKHTHAPHAHEHEIARKHGSCKGVRLGPVNSLNYMHRKFHVSLTYPWAFSGQLHF